jgi:hypothetical protein
MKEQAVEELRKLTDGRCWVLESPGLPDFIRRCRQRGTKPHGRRDFVNATHRFGGELENGESVAKAETPANANTKADAKTRSLRCGPR